MTPSPTCPPRIAPASRRWSTSSATRREFAHHLKLWFLAVLTAMPACEAKRQALDLPEVDQFLAEQAKAAGVKVVALETPQEQLDAIASMRPEVAATLLAVDARDPEMNDDLYARC